MMKFHRALATFGFVAAAAALIATTSQRAEADQNVIQPSDSITQLSDNPFNVSASPVTVGKGESGKLTITIKATDGHKVNESYPHKAKFGSTDGVSLGSEKITGCNFVDKQTCVLSTSVKGLQAGEHKLEGMAKFSVCNDSQCLIKKVPLTASITVK